MAEADVRDAASPDWYLPRSEPTRALRVYERAVAAAPLALRLPLGIVMAAHGAQKLTDFSAARTMFESIGFSPGTLWAGLAGVVELAAGAALVAGLLTRVAALLLFGVQLVALLWVHLPHGLFLNWGMEAGKGHGFEYNLVNLGALAALVFLGSGKLGVDEAIRRKKGLRTVPVTERTAAGAVRSERTDYQKKWSAPSGDLEPLRPKSHLGEEPTKH